MVFWISQIYDSYKECKILTLMASKQKTFFCFFRLGKDLEFYRKEERSQTEKIEKMKKEQADPYSIKKQVTLF